MIRGIGTSKGIGMGNAVLVDIKDTEFEVINIEDVNAEKVRFKEAVEEFIKTTQTVIEQLSSKLKDNNNTALVMQNQIYIIKDPEMTQGVNDIIESEKICAEAAFDAICNKFIKIFQAMDNEAMNQRVADIEDLRNHVIDILMGKESRFDKS
jgi:phosphotransferase system enzyme I (PtsI)